MTDSILSSVRTTCPYCGVGCGVNARSDGRRLIAVEGDPAHPANRGRLCIKGTTLPDTQTGAGRLEHPMIRGERTSWEHALDTVARGFLETIDRHGPDSVAFYLSGQLLTEDYYVANKLMKGFLGSANVDTNSRLCMASAVAAHKRAFGEDVVPCDYDDLDACELIVFVGSNAAWTHPVLYQRLAARRASSDLKVVVIDPRRTATCDIADLHLAIRPGMDAALFNALLVDLHDRGALDRRFVASHTEGMDQALTSARRDATHVAELTGLPADRLRLFFDWFAASEKVVTFYSQGVNQSANGTDKANAIINAHLATGRIGRPGAGPFSITGQPNAMGGREVGGMANQLAAHRDFDPQSIESIGRFWGAAAMADKPGLKAVELFQAVARGAIRAIWIMGTNPVVSLPKASEVATALAGCPLVVVSDCVADTETSRYAHVLLPAQGWGEKDGTVTNSERCISRQRSFLPPAGEARPDWWIVTRVAARMGFGDAFSYRSPSEIFREHAALSASVAPDGQLFRLDAYAQVTDAAYDALEPVRWIDRPFAAARFATPSGRARFVPVPPFRPVQQAVSTRSFIVNTGRLRDQWHTMTRTGLAPKLFGHVDAPSLAVHPEDAAALGLAAGQLVELRNASGRIRALCEHDGAIPRGTVFFPIHWNGEFASPCRVSDLVEPVTDPISGQPESKHAIAELSAIDAGGWIRCVSPRPLAGIDSLLRIRRPSPFGWCYEFAVALLPTSPEVLVAALGPAARTANLIRLSQPGGGRWLLEQDEAIVMSGAAARIREALPGWDSLEGPFQASADADWRLLGNTPAAPGGRIVCTCFEVREDHIRDAIGRGATDATALGDILGCGTNCGSCVPELNTLLRNQRTDLSAVASAG